MNDLRSLDDRLLTDVAGLVRAGLLVRRTGTDRALAAAGWAALATLLAVGLDQPLGAPTGGHAPVLESTTREATTA